MRRHGFATIWHDVKWRQEEKAKGRSKKKSCEANYIAHLNYSIILAYFYADIDWKSCKNDCIKKVGVDVHNLIIDVL